MMYQTMYHNRKFLPQILNTTEASSTVDLSNTNMNSKDGNSWTPVQNSLVQRKVRESALHVQGSPKWMNSILIVFLEIYWVTTISALFFKE